MIQGIISIIVMKLCMTQGGLRSCFEGTICKQLFHECLNVTRQRVAAQTFYSKTIGGMFTQENAASQILRLSGELRPSLRTTRLANC